MKTTEDYIREFMTRNNMMEYTDSDAIFVIALFIMSILMDLLLTVIAVRVFGWYGLLVPVVTVFLFAIIRSILWWIKPKR